jgi:hypothetical protein
MISRPYSLSLSDKTDKVSHQKMFSIENLTNWGQSYISR